MSKFSERIRYLRDSWRESQQEASQTESCDLHAFKKVKGTYLYKCKKCEKHVPRILADWYKLGVKHGSRKV